MSLFSRAILLGSLAFMAAGVPETASAQATFPARSITLVVPAAAGGPTDTVARLIAESMNRTLGQTVVATVGATDVIRRVTFVRTGSVTHSINNDQRFISVKFTQAGNVVTATLPSAANVMLPGYYMMFVFAGRAPSVAKIILIHPR